MEKAAMITMIALVTVMSGGKKYHPDSDSNTFECTEAEAEKLVRIDAAKIVEQAGSDDTGTGSKDPLLALKKDELVALADARKVTIPEGVTTKANIIAFLNSPEGQCEA